MIELLVNTQTQLSVQFSAGDATGNVTVTVKDQDNTVLVNGATATHDTTGGAVGRYTYTLTPDKVTQPAWLVVTWSGTFGGQVQSISTGAGEPDGTSGEVQVVGGHLFTIAELRAFGDGKLSNTTKYPDETLIDARSRVTQLFEQFCDVAFFTRYGRVTRDGSWQPAIWLPNNHITKIRSVSINGTALTGSDLANVALVPDGKVWRSSYYNFWDGTNPQNVVIAYEHGYGFTPPDVARAGMILARYELGITELDSRMISFTNELGVVRVAPLDEEHPTGIPFVDATLRRYSERSSAFVY